MGVLVVRVQSDGAAGLGVGLVGRIGAEQRLGADRANHGPVRQFGHKLVTDRQGADVVFRGECGEGPLDQIVNFGFFHDRRTLLSAVIVMQRAIVA